MNKRKYKSKDGRIAIVTGVSMLGDIMLLTYLCEHDGAYELQIDAKGFLKLFTEIR